MIHLWIVGRLFLVHPAFPGNVIPTDWVTFALWPRQRECEPLRRSFTPKFPEEPFLGGAGGPVSAADPNPTCTVTPMPSAPGTPAVDRYTGVTEKFCTCPGRFGNGGRGRSG